MKRYEKISFNPKILIGSLLQSGSTTSTSLASSLLNGDSEDIFGKTRIDERKKRVEEITPKKPPRSRLHEGYTQPRRINFISKPTIVEPVLVQLDNHTLNISPILKKSESSTSKEEIVSDTSEYELDSIWKLDKERSNEGTTKERERNQNKICTKQEIRRTVKKRIEKLRKGHRRRVTLWRAVPYYCYRWGMTEEELLDDIEHNKYICFTK
ncbi:hypothetical protein EHI8A_055350 [Entamoeba histolytica HM-1:IMSS-B]|uniref:Uncharacterized protein n=6 Tax=Entamoeba histolytica TaxID=5759 RepID=C4MA83_ENTH1|nr:hypothetical protein EHI_067250 [Entamoeba histolytica HM-1:IMSS]EMD48237.1 Hypothetical protein EHI5A_078780 [Entamoeba histolytica KU27]EMH75536.1 hypothetical protein EHI8A_055350 [Entamoeba histolytica HM-1:IMSS-B]EMS11086.1 hypothetical protein KM1_095840 [Entamoeba histolytica HM-3:IMSS]ENY62851.1 hypothetical protein EHI7A_048790 [Entamoeba histolytica HM-1:IMSS-A]GAT98674.1 hypothetical protein CL6EHI_067250 [Entamoeba histolytica]|eukprot:XP_652657.1 hypothetical protein EHI_067250 [Entamoeba histolytica HM-1:IMSS]